MIIIGVGTMNPAKIEAVNRLVALTGMDAEVRSYDVPSGVSAMPLSDHETRQGAMNRSRAVLERDGEVSIGIGLEGGVSLVDGEMFLCNWGAAADHSGKVITAGGARIRLPDSLAEGVRSGRELGDVTDEYAHQKDVKKNGGTIGILTENRVTRSDMFFHILKLIDGLYKHQKKE